MIIEKSILDYLLGAGMSVGTDVYCEVPLYPPEEYILIEHTAGSEDNYIRSAMVAVQSISRASLYRAMEINEEVLEAMRTYDEESTDVYGCKLNSNYNFTNTATKEYRYQAVFDVHY